MRTKMLIPMPDKEPGKASIEGFNEAMRLMLEGYYRAARSENIKRGIARARVARAEKVKNGR